MVSQKNHKKRRKHSTVDLLPLLRGVKEALIHDLSGSNLGRICSKYDRGQDVPFSMGWPPYVFKRMAQIRNFDKRVIWPEDKSFDELSVEAFSAFAESQQTFNLPEPLSLRASRVTHHAANLVQKVLGKFDSEEWLSSCSYGKRAAYKLPRSKAYLDTRVKTPSGSAMQVAAFRQVLSRDTHLLRAMRESRRETPTVHDKIKVTAVPKSFKAARIIAPDTVLGGFLSRGLGDMIRKRLEKETHIDLAQQQERHRRWAQNASVTGRASTIDMSKASDSFTWRHIEVLVPKDWHEALRCVRVGVVEVPKMPDVHLRSYMLMGSGHTFPLQTLLFWALAEATRTLLKSRGKVSVYGDDIILPTRCAPQFIALMNELGFTINSEKSFYDAPDSLMPSHRFFRESCGGDYKGGLDVRPYMPECDLQVERNVPSNYYLAWCHKLINGLLDRWDASELPVTLGLLFRMISDRKRRICFVPSWEVDHAGIKHYIPSYLLIGYDVSYIAYEHSHPKYWRISFNQPKRKRSIRERAYLWYAYHLKRDNAAPRFKIPIFFQVLQMEREIELAKSYETVTSLSGEPDRSKNGSYRWVSFGPKEMDT
jgi:hypothetical protein